MIKNIIVPQKIGSYYLIPTTIIGIDINKTHMSATKLYVRGRSYTVQESIREQLPAGTAADYQERTTATLKKIIQQLGHYDELHTSLSSSVVVFKELTLPFTTANKIELVVGFEVEPLLPFALNDAVVDFIITRQVDTHSSDVLVAAVQNQHIAAHLAIFQAAGFDPSAITVDLFALYALYTQLSEKPTTTNVILLDVGSYTTHIAYIYQHQLRFIRSLPTGFVDQVKKISEQLKLPHAQVLEYFMRFGLETETQEPAYTQAAHTIFAQFVNTLGFTITSFSSQLAQSHEESTLLIADEGATIKGLAEFMQQTLNIPTHTLTYSMLASLPGIQFAHKNSFDLATTISLATALPATQTASFNLRKKEFKHSGERKQAEQQLLIIVGLTLFILGALFTATTFQLRKISSSLTTTRQEVTELVEKRFGIPAEGQDLEDLIQTAQRSVQEEEKLWFSLANPARLSFLHYLLELTNRIDKEGLGFAINSIKISDDIITLQARVRDYTALSLFEKELRQSPLFSYVEGQDNPEFTMKIRLAKNPRKK